MGNQNSTGLAELTPNERDKYFQARQILCGTRVDEIHPKNLGSEVTKALVSPTLILLVTGHIPFTS